LCGEPAVAVGQPSGQTTEGGYLKLRAANLKRAPCCSMLVSELNLAECLEKRRNIHPTGHLWSGGRVANRRRSRRFRESIPTHCFAVCAAKRPLSPGPDGRHGGCAAKRTRPRASIGQPRLASSPREAADLLFVVMQHIKELGTIVSVWAHPDDEAYLCGGIMAMAAAAQSRVICVTATRGELGVTDPTRWPPEQLPSIREAELAECLRILGVTEHRWLGYPDGGCDSVDAEIAVENIAKIIRDVAPDTVLTFPPDGQTGHPDHIAVHHWTVEAVRRTGIGALHVVANTQEWLDDHLALWTELGAIVGEPPVAWTGPLSIDVAVTGELLEIKYAALAAQASQTEVLRGVLGEQTYRDIIQRERFAAFLPQQTPMSHAPT
jgi:LmbE family N-acetylglucosaminyl deacetylase